MRKKHKSPVVNILMLPLTERGARSTAAMLHRLGYTQATVEICRRRSPIEIAAFFEPLNPDDQKELLLDIARATGLMPSEKKET